MTAARIALALVATTAASVTAIATHHKHSATPSSATTLAEPAPPRVSRWLERKPLPRHVKTPRARQRPHLTIVGQYADVTEYCATGNRNAAGRWPQLGDVAVLNRSIPFGTRVLIDGNVYTVRDWIGWGSDFDIYGGNAGCEQRALNFGRRHLRVVVQR